MIKKLAIVLVNYNSEDLTIECIRSIHNSTANNYSIIVVDNASPSGIKKLDKISDIVLLTADENNGFASGNNIGIRYALESGAEYILLLNNDTEIDSQLLNILLTHNSGNEVSVPQIFFYSQPQKVWYGGGFIDYKRGKAVHITENCNQERYLDFASGCCMLIPKSVIEEVGYFEEKYFMYCEDLEYCLRLKRNHIKIKYVPQAVVWHKVGGSQKSSKTNFYYDTRNRLYLINEYDFPWTAKIYVITTRFMRFLQGIIQHNDFSVIWKAIKDYRAGVIGKVDI